MVKKVAKTRKTSKSAGKRTSTHQTESVSRRAASTPKKGVALPKSAASKIKPGKLRTSEAQPEPQEQSISRGVDSSPSITLQDSRRFWLLLLGGGLLLLAIIQGYGYFSGWGDSQKVIQRYFNTAQRLTLAKRYDAVIRQYQKIVEMSEDEEVDRQAYIALADIYRERQEWTKAIEIYRKLQSNDTNKVMLAWTGLKIGESQYDSGELAAALATYQEIRKSFPKTDWDAEARLGIGKIYEVQRRFKEAISVYQSLEKDYRGGFLAAEALLQVGSCYIKQDNRKAAKITFQTIVEKYPATMADEAKKQLRRLERNLKPEGVSLWGE